MTSPAYLRQLARKCNGITAEIADEFGFVALQRLVDHFQAEILVRPLLVEAMLASTESDLSHPHDGNRHQWCLFVDRETYDVDEPALKNECIGSPLPPRLRNTVAHELAHSLAFRATEFGVELPKRKTSAKNKRDFVALIERETEKLSPLLLISNRALARILPENKTMISVEDLRSLANSMGVSRPVLVNRLNLLELHDEMKLSERRCLRNLGVGVGRWLSTTDAVLKPWPVYSNFDGARVPSFMFQLQRGLEVSPKNILPSSDFSMLGGALQYIECSVDAGTPKNPKHLRLPVRFEVEPQPPKAGAEFLFLVQSLDSGHGQLAG